MNNARLAAIYYSTHGTNRVTAQTATEAARGTAAEARLLRVRETASPEVVKSQDAWATPPTRPRTPRSQAAMT